MADLSSILGGMVQGFKDFGTGLVDMFGTGGAAIGDLFQSGGRSTKNQDDFRKWLYQTDNTQDAAAKGLGTILNGVQTVADVIPGAQAVTANPLFNGLQGAVAGVSDELKMAGKDADWGRAAQRAGVGGASGLLSAAAGQNLQKSGSKLLNNGLTRGAVQGAIGGGIANAGYTGIEGGSVQDMINAGLYGAQTGALVGGATGLARELIKPTHKMDVALTDDERRARIANIDDQLAKLDTSTTEGNARYNELMTARNNYANDEMLKLYRGMSAPDDTTLQKYIDDLRNPNIEPTNYSGGSAYGKGYYFTPDEGLARYYASESGLPSTAVLEIEVPKNRFTEINKANGNRPADFDLAAVKRGVPEDIRYETGLKDFNDYLDNNGYWGSKTSDDGTYTIMRNDAVLNAKKVGETPKTVADLMAEPKPKTIYHGTNAVFEDFDESLPSVWFTDNADDIANTGLSNKGGKINIMERELPNNLKLADWDLADRLTKQQLIDRGYDGIAYTESGTSGKDTYYEIFKPNKTLKKIGKAPQKTVADLMLSPSDDKPKSGTGKSIVINGKERNFDELYELLSTEAGAFENENKTPINKTPEQLRSEIGAIDAQYPGDMPDDIYDKRYDLNAQLRAVENGYNSEYDYYVGESKKRFNADLETTPDRFTKKIADIERKEQKQAILEQDIKNATPRKLAQFNIIQQKNPAPNDTLTWIRSPKDIMTWEEAILAGQNDGEAFSWPDYTLEKAIKDNKRGYITVYSSYPVKGGTFVTPSYQQARDYAGGGRVYSKVVRPNDVAWINGDEGQYAYTRVKDKSEVK